MDDQFRELMLATTEEMLSAQLRAVRSLRAAHPRQPHAKRQSMSQIDMAYSILQDAQQPLHITRIIELATQRFGVTPDRESLVSSLTKRVARQDRFVRVGPNRFALRSLE